MFYLDIPQVPLCFLSIKKLLFVKCNLPACTISYTVFFLTVSLSHSRLFEILHIYNKTVKCRKKCFKHNIKCFISNPLHIVFSKQILERKRNHKAELITAIRTSLTMITIFVKSLPQQTKQFILGLNCRAKARLQTRNSNVYRKGTQTLEKFKTRL